MRLYADNHFFQDGGRFCHCSHTWGTPLFNSPIYHRHHHCFLGKTAIRASVSCIARLIADRQEACFCRLTAVHHYPKFNVYGDKEAMRFGFLRLQRRKKTVWGTSCVFGGSGANFSANPISMRDGLGLGDGGAGGGWGFGFQKPTWGRPYLFLLWLDHIHKNRPWPAALLNMWDRVSGIKQIPPFEVRNNWRRCNLKKNSNLKKYITVMFTSNASTKLKVFVGVIFDII